MGQAIFVNTDGGSRGNPGPAAIGIVISDGAEILYSYKHCLGEATNNEAEYQAVIYALQILKKSNWYTLNNKKNNEIIFRLDSQLVVEQLNGNYKIKQPHILDFANRIKELLSDIALKVKFIYVPREQNKLADKLVNQALDQEKLSK